MQEESPPWENLRLGCLGDLPHRERRQGWWHKVLRGSLCEWLWWRWGVSLAGRVYVELHPAMSGGRGEGGTGWMGSLPHPNLTLPITSSAELPLTQRSAELGMGRGGQELVDMSGCPQREPGGGARGGSPAPGTPNLGIHLLLAGGTKAFPPGWGVQSQPWCSHRGAG